MEFHMQSLNSAPQTSTLDKVAIRTKLGIPSPEECLLNSKANLDVARTIGDIEAQRGARLDEAQAKFDADYQSAGRIRRWFMTPPSKESHIEISELLEKY